MKILHLVDKSQGKFTEELVGLSFLLDIKVILVM